MTEGLSRYGASRLEGSPAVVSCGRLPGGYANANYRLETDSGVFLLRDRLDHDRESVEFELEVLDWLRLHEFPISKVFDPANAPRPDWSLPQKLIGFFREAKEKRFWKEFKLEGTTWRATHLFVSTASTVQFTQSRVFVDPPDLKVGVPFVHDSAYQLISPRRIEGMTTRTLPDGQRTAGKVRGGFARWGDDLNEVWLILGVDRQFVFRRIQSGQVDDPTGLNQDRTSR